MNRTLPIFASAFLFAGTSVGLAGGNAADNWPTASAVSTGAAGRADVVRVPLPIARPSFIVQRVAASEGAGARSQAPAVERGQQTAQTGTSQGSAPQPGTAGQDTATDPSQGRALGDTPAPGGAGGGSAATVAPGADGTGMKSGSSEALAVQLEGAKVVSIDGDVVGQVEKVVEQSGAGRQAVVSVGGFLGIGTSRVLVPAEAMSPGGSGMVRVELTEDQLKSMPAYEGK